MLFICFQESISDFYWYYSGKDIIDESGQHNFSKALAVTKQIFNSLTEYIQVCAAECMLVNKRMFSTFLILYFAMVHLGAPGSPCIQPPTLTIFLVYKQAPVVPILYKKPWFVVPQWDLFTALSHLFAIYLFTASPSRLKIFCAQKNVLLNL